MAEELDIPQWKANEVCWCLERVFYGEAGVRYRVTRRSLDVLKALLAQGVSLGDARALMYQHVQRGELPALELDDEEQRATASAARRRRQHQRARLPGQTDASWAYWRSP